MSSDLETATKSYTGAEIRAIMDAVNVDKAKPAAIAAYRALLADRPAVWRLAGDMAATAEKHMVKAVRSNALMKEAVLVGMDTLRADLGYADAPTLEKLLIEQVVLCWFQLYEVQYSYTSVMAESVTLIKAGYWERRLTTAQGRYLRATETLARVRRLGKVTPLQLNIGAHQVNVGGS